MSTLQPGTKVEARYKGRMKYFPGKIDRKRADGTYSITYDDGDKELSVRREHIRVVRKGLPANDSDEDARRPSSTWTTAVPGGLRAPRGGPGPGGIFRIFYDFLLF